jgi:hypothetical protein
MIEQNAASSVQEKALSSRAISETNRSPFDALGVVLIWHRSCYTEGHREAEVATSAGWQRFLFKKLAA